MAEPVVLLDSDNNPIGHADKQYVHTKDTQLHLAFSCYLYNDKGELLITRRALEKKTWPGVWTNSFCGHPAPGESFDAAIARRAQVELGTKVADVITILPSFSYRAVDASGIVEYEFCPVHAARIDAPLEPNPTEVMDYAWVDPAALAHSARNMPELLSPGMVEQIEQITQQLPQDHSGVAIPSALRALAGM